MVEKKYNIFSVLAIIFAFLFPLAGIIFGVIALKQIKKTKEKGRGLAITAIVLPIIMIILVGIVWAIVQSIMR
ncbi:MAG: DUF4190 domain-containing protein [Nanoarchaeota archaeon]|nr:DUF4190 domain-containing protein [Nanoarchaeota archaeon]